MLNTVKKRILAMDYGASGGRGIIGEYNGSNLNLIEVHRFENNPVFAGETMYWDVLRLIHELKNALGQADREGGVDSLSIDTWGVDFGLLDEYGSLIGNPVHYRDKRTHGMMDIAHEYMSGDEIYNITGIQAMELNTLYQILALKKNTQAILERAKTLLLMPDLMGYFLTGTGIAEYSIASTTQILDAESKAWSKDIIKAFGIDSSMLPNVEKSGTVLGSLLSGIKSELSLHSEPKVIAGLGHDTQAAMLAVPAAEEDFVFISCGTWAIFGTEISAPIINQESGSFNLSNEGGFNDKISFLKNIVGTWLIQESRNQWRREGKEYSFSDLEELAGREESFASVINPDDPEFASAGDMPKRIREYCARTNQSVPGTPGAIVRSINESLALTYRYALGQISKCTGKTYHKIYVVGGGSQSKLLCQMTADATGAVVSAGPVEATVLGNISAQLIASGELSSAAEARSVISQSLTMNTYEPRVSSDWDKAYERYLKLRSESYGKV